jgi:hypothetical protein
MPRQGDKLNMAVSGINTADRQHGKNRLPFGGSFICRKNTLKNLLTM